MVKRYSQVYSLYVDLETAYKVLSDPERFLSILGIFDTVTPVDQDTAEVEVVTKLALGVSRKLKARFRRLLEPPGKIVLISEGSFVMTITAQLEPRAVNETRLALTIQVSASFFTESTLAYRIASAIGKLGLALQEGLLGTAKPAAASKPIPVTVSANPGMGQASPKGTHGPVPGTIDKYSENMADSLILSSLLLNSKYLAHIKARYEGLEDLLSKVKSHAEERGSLYIVVSPEGGNWTLRLLARGREIVAAVYDEGKSVFKGREALLKLDELKGGEFRVKIFEADPDTVSRILG